MYASSTHKKWLTLSDICLAFLGAVLVFSLLDIVTGGLLVSVAMAVAALVLVGVIQYWSWGRVASKQVVHPHVPTQNPQDEFVLELNDREREELLHLLEDNLPKGEQPSEEKLSGGRTGMRRNLLDKVRMFGA